jgi:hypothetical protein
VSERDRLVRLPLLVQVGIVDEDEEVVLLALVMDLDLGSLASGHCEGKLDGFLDCGGIGDW